VINGERIDIIRAKGPDWNHTEIQQPGRRGEKLLQIEEHNLECHTGGLTRKGPSEKGCAVAVMVVLHYGVGIFRESGEQGHPHPEKIKRGTFSNHSERRGKSIKMNLSGSQQSKSKEGGERRVRTVITRIVLFEKGSHRG